MPGAQMTMSVDFGDPDEVRGFLNFLEAFGRDMLRENQPPQRGNGASHEPRPRHEARPMSWARFEGTLTNNTRRFLAELQKRGRLTLTQAINLLVLQDGREPGKSVGGMIGAMSRKASNHGVPLPFETTENKFGERMWVWKGIWTLRGDTAPPGNTVQ